MNVTLDPGVRGRLVAGIVRWTGLSVQEDNSRWEVITDLCRTLQAEYGELQISQVPGVEWARRLYSSVGIDPTKHRPSSEALLRRALKGESLYQINTLVDAMNWCSLEFLLPIGLYDLDWVKGDVVLRIGQEGESYQGIGRGLIHVGGRLTAVDDAGAFGSPTADSARTAISEKTVRALAVIYAPADFPAEELAENVEAMAERAQSWCGGEVEMTDVLR